MYIVRHFATVLRKGFLTELGDMETSVEPDPKPVGLSSTSAPQQQHRQNALAGALPVCSNSSQQGNASVPQPASAQVEGPVGTLDASAHRFKSGIGSFQGLIDDLVASVDREREELRQAKEHLEQEKKQFALEKERVNQVLNDNEQVGKFDAYMSMRNVHSTSWEHADCTDLFHAACCEGYVVTSA